MLRIDYGVRKDELGTIFIHMAQSYCGNLFAGVELGVGWLQAGINQ